MPVGAFLTRRGRALAAGCLGILALAAAGACATYAAYHVADAMSGRLQAGVRGDEEAARRLTRTSGPARPAAPPLRLADADDLWTRSLRTGTYWSKRSESGAKAGSSSRSASRRSQRGRERVHTREREAAKEREHAREREPTREREREQRSVSKRQHEPRYETRSRPRHAYTSTTYVASVPSEWRSTERHGSGTYRTVCVRLCDGFYWPISFATTAGSFDRDSSVCTQSCSSPTALYYYPNPGGEPEDMVNLKGEPYLRLGKAFLYRTSYNAACKCKPHPWEQEAAEQHRRHAEEAPEAQEGQEAQESHEEPAAPTAEE